MKLTITHLFCSERSLETGPESSGPLARLIALVDCPIKSIPDKSNNGFGVNVTHSEENIEEETGVKRISNNKEIFQNC